MDASNQTLLVNDSQETPKPKKTSETTNSDKLSPEKSEGGNVFDNMSTYQIIRVFLAASAVIGDKFFPNSNKSLQVLEVFALFAGSYFIRPLGGLIFGYIGDKYGRLVALRISIFMMAIPCFLTGILPTYHTIGITATILLGISVGGELSGALTYILEICPQNRRALFGNLVMITSSGAVVASLFLAILHYSFSRSQFHKFAWRLPFILGLLVALYGIRLRTFLKESPVFKEYNESKPNEIKNPAKKACLNNKLEIISIILHTGFNGTTYYVLFVWMPVYLQSKHMRQDKYVINNPYLINVICAIITLPTGLISSILGDKYTPSKIQIIGGIIFIVAIIICFPLLEHTTKYSALLICSILSITYGCYYGPNAVWDMNILTDPTTRNTVYGLAYNFATALFFGTTPLISTIIVEWKSIILLGWILVIFGVISIVTIILYPFLRKYCKNSK